MIDGFEAFLFNKSYKSKSQWVKVKTTVKWTRHFSQNSLLKPWYQIKLRKNLMTFENQSTVVGSRQIIMIKQF